MAQRVVAWDEPESVRDVDDSHRVLYEESRLVQYIDLLDIVERSRLEHERHAPEHGQRELRLLARIEYDAPCLPDLSRDLGARAEHVGFRAELEHRIRAAVLPEAVPALEVDLRSVLPRAAPVVELRSRGQDAPRMNVCSRLEDEGAEFERGIVREVEVDSRGCVTGCADSDPSRAARAKFEVDRPARELLAHAVEGAIWRADDPLGGEIDAARARRSELERDVSLRPGVAPGKLPVRLRQDGDTSSEFLGLAPVQRHVLLQRVELRGDGELADHAVVVHHVHPEPVAARVEARELECSRLVRPRERVGALLVDDTHDQRVAALVQ